MPRAGLIGAGAMGEALISGLLRDLPREELVVCEVSEPRAEYIRSRYGVGVTKYARRVAEACEICIVAVKPADVMGVLRDIRGGLAGILVSVAVGVRLEDMEGALGEGSMVVRAMPNIACSIGEGVIGLSRGRWVDDRSYRSVRDLLGITGRVVDLPEDLLDPLASLSGCGIAFCLVFLEAMKDSGVVLGLRSDVSMNIACQTLLGASKLVMEKGEHPAKLRELVSTPGGMTIRGIFALEEAGLRSAVMKAIISAYSGIRSG